MIPAVPAIVDDAAQNANAPLLPETNLKGRRPPARQKRPTTVLPAIAWTVLLLALVGLVVYRQGHGGGRADTIGDEVASAGRAVEVAASRGAVQGVSEKSTASALLGGGAYDWTNAMLAWQRTAFHFQPQKNWMNDPNGPLYYKGWYHLFYQWNPDGAVWGNITWGHAVSRDLLHWLHLPLAMVPDHWYDINGVWTGSATQLPDGRIVMLYTGSTEDGAQVQLLAEPADPSDPLLRRWAKSEANPVLVPPPGIGLTDFRDPTTAWLNPADKAWRITIGSKNQEHAGLALVYRTEDFLHYDLLPTLLHVVQGTGMWECVDFYPVSTEPAAGVGLDTSTAPGAGVKHVLKTSLDDDRNDYYAIGTYDPATDRWAPDDAAIDVGIGLRYDYGKFYASKTFYDPVGRRRVLWGWIGESDSERADILKGWASLQVPEDGSHGHQDGQQPAPMAGGGGGEPPNARQALRRPRPAARLRCAPGRRQSNTVGHRGGLPGAGGRGGCRGRGGGGGSAVQLQRERRRCGAGLARPVRAARAGRRRPVGADRRLLLPGQGRGRQAQHPLLPRRLQSSKANDLVKAVYGSLVPVLDGEDLSVRILVDHSIVESFAQGGRTCITSRVYPTKAIYDSARVFLFNNATNVNVTAKSIKIWELNSAYIRPYPDSS
ncbi:unnamed protein product [Triticum turgidum subsp. durum]|uniref:Beta-fructofuranosidase n=1 Tax=Triticum turgidum subsp. durum TaxID=4567 RepID=A0A9R1PUI2_TRITD|nr:unnamed protein product [Triticum turgidum subsp. durum]